MGSKSYCSVKHEIGGQVNFMLWTSNTYTRMEGEACKETKILESLQRSQDPGEGEAPFQG